MYSLAHWAASLPINLYVLRVLLDSKIVSLVIFQMYNFEMIENFIRKRIIRLRTQIDTISYSLYEKKVIYCQEMIIIYFAEQR